MSTNDLDRPSAPAGTIGHFPPPSAGRSTPTFPSEAESLLGHLKLGAAPGAAAPPPAAGWFPNIPGYEIECELGKGGMGVVYKARHAALRHTVAVKMILASARASSAEVARFVAEAEAIAAVKHANVVQVYDLGETDGRPYFVMEFVDGGNVAGLLRGGPLGPDRAAELIGAVARGVQAAHDVGIVHRDLKPANVLLSIADCGSQNADSKTPDGAPVGPRSSSLQSAIRNPQSAIPKVSDFGLAKRLSSDMTRSQAVMGTPAYMAPEQAGGKAKFVGPQADVYALGAILYECLTGRPPFEDADPWGLIRKVLEDAPDPKRLRAAGVPRDLELICLKCLEKEPHHRYPTAAALADDLGRFLAREPVSVRPIGAPTRAVRWAKKRPAWAAVAVLGTLLALGAPAAAVWVQGRLDRRAAAVGAAQEREDAANQRRISAELLAEAEKRAKGEAERLAETRELFALQNALRNRASDRPLGWTAVSRAELPRAVELAGGGPETRADLRSTAAVVMLAHDLFPLDPVAPGLNAAAAATDPKSGLVALGEHKAWGAGRVLLVNPATGKTVRELTFPTVAVRGPGGAFDLVQDGTRALAFSPDGARLFVGTRSSRVVRFDLDDPRTTPALVWNASAAPVEQLAVSPDGKTVYGLCRPEAPVFAWAADTGKPRKPFAAPDGVTSFAVLPAGELIAVTGSRLCRWRADGAEVRTVPNAGGSRLAFAGGSTLLVGAGARLDVHDAETFDPTDRFADPTLRRAAHDEGIRTIEVHPSGAFAATAAFDADRTVKVWELASGQLVGTGVAPGTGPVAVAWSGDGAYLLASARGHVARWRFAPGGQRFVCRSGFMLAAAAFAPDGRVAALGESFNGRREALVGAEAADAARVQSPGGNEHPGVVVGPAGALVVAAGNAGAVRWKPGTAPQPPAPAKQTVSGPRFSPDGRTLWAIVGSKTVRAYDPVTLKERAQWSNAFSEVVSGLASIDALAAGRTGAAAGGRDGSVYLLGPACAVAATFFGPGDPVLAVAFAPDDALVVAGTQGGKLRVIRPADKTELPAVPAHPGGVTAVGVSRDGTLLATGGRDRTVRLWKRTGGTFEPLLTIPDLPGGVRDVQFSPTDGRLLVLLANEHAVRVWDVDRLKAQLAELKLGW